MAHTSQKDLRLKLQNYTDTTKAHSSHQQPANMPKVDPQNSMGITVCM